MIRWPTRLRFYCLLLTIYLLSQIYIFNYHPNAFDRESGSKARKIFEYYKNLSVRLNEESHFDTSGTYKIFSLENSKTNISRFDITLVSQCSSNHIHLIESLCDSWKGPISICVFTEVENVEKTTWDLAKILHCTNCNVKLHLVVPSQSVYIKHFTRGWNALYENEKSMPCQFSHLDGGEKNYNRAIRYPINLLRNVAKSGSVTDYILIIDIDMVPNPKLRDDFLSLARTRQSNRDKAVYVVPAFEVRANVEIPKTKDELIEQVKEKKTRPFYFVPCRSCQKYTRYNKWLMSDKTSVSRILYEVEWRHPWEPFFIAPNDVPNFDERFKQYGMNRISQICELHVAGYRFFILDKAFLVHRGFKEIGDFHGGKNAEMESNRKLYARFKSELKFRYPKSEGKC